MILANDPNTDDFPITLRKEKLSDAEYFISIYGSLKHQTFITVVDVLRNLAFVQEALKDEN